MHNCGLKITRFRKAHAHFVVSPSRLRLEFDRKMQIFDGFRISLFLIKCDSHTILSEVEGLPGRKCQAEKRNRLFGLSVVQRKKGSQSLVADDYGILWINSLGALNRGS